MSGELVRTDRAPPPVANDDLPAVARAPVRAIEVSPDQVFQHEPVKPTPWREHSFAAPVLLVIVISAAMLYGTIAVVALLWTWLG